MKVAFLQPGVGWLAVQWFFTGLLIAFSAATVGYTGWLLRRLFTTEPLDTGAPEPTP